MLRGRSIQESHCNSENRKQYVPAILIEMLSQMTYLNDGKRLTMAMIRVKFHYL
jgi:hypothetical protein